MPASNQFFITGVDFTALLQVSASTFNQAVNLAVTAGDKGIIIVTQDIAEGVADTPDVATVPEFGKHLWLRKPFNLDNDATLNYWNGTEWKTLLVDITTLTALITNAQTDATNALTQIAATNSNLAATSTVANTASLAATAAQTSADNALAAANGAQASADNAQGSANTAIGLGFKKYTSTVVPLTYNTLNKVDEAHELGGMPEIIRAVLVCLVADRGYQPNDEIDSSAVANYGSLYNFIIIYANSTNIYAAIPATADVPVTSLQIKEKTTGVFDHAVRANWALKVYAFKHS